MQRERKSEKEDQETRREGRSLKKTNYCDTNRERKKRGTKKSFVLLVKSPGGLATERERESDGDEWQPSCCSIRTQTEDSDRVV